MQSIQVNWQSLIRANNIESIRFHLEHGANPNEANGALGVTPLMYAAQYGADEIAKHLIASGANLNATDNDGNCALHYAVSFNKLTTVKLLFNAETVALVKNKNGLTPLEMAYNRNHLEIVQYMMRQIDNLPTVTVDNEGNYFLPAEYMHVPNLQNWPQNLESTENPLCCSECHESFKSIDTFEIHQRIHEEAKLLKCTTCNLKYKSIGGFLYHQRVHHKDKGLRCSRGIQQAFNKGVSDIEKHGQVLEIRKEFKCGKCGKVFANELHFQEHQQICEFKELFQCSVCSMRFESQTQLLLHQSAGQCRRE